MTPTVALAFDDGPAVPWTEQILNVLDRHEARATFFILGCNIGGQEDALRRMVAGGHEIALHGWNHLAINHMNDAELREALYRTVAKLTDLGLPEPRWWHPPWNRNTDSSIRLVSELGYGFCRPTLDAGDVVHGGEWIVGHVLRNLAEGSIIGLHDGIASNGQQGRVTRKATVNATGRILEHCRSVTVSELLA
jgi:peptidoglycan/xylan/chitin deacetylase (PgdA/CDA1 family)